MKRRGRRLTRGLSWFVAVGGVAAAMLLAFTAFAVQGKPGTFTAVRSAMDSAAAKPPPNPTTKKCKVRKNHVLEKER